MPVATVPEVDAGSPGVDEQASQSELRELVWAAAAGLEPRDRVVLDLSVRQELSGADIAEALGVRTDHAHVLVSNVRKRVERALGALLVLRVGRRDCPQLESALADWDGRFSPEVRRRVTRHVDDCEICGQRRTKLVTPTALLSVVPLAPAPLALREVVLGRPELGQPPPARRTRRRFPPRERSMLARVATGAAVVTGVGALAGGVFVATRGDGENGVAPAAASSPSSSVTTSTTETAETFCSVSAELAAVLGQQGPASPDPAALEDYLRTQIEYYERLEALAPQEIAGDLGSLLGATRALVAELEAAEFSPAALAAAGDDPVLTATGERVESFIATECGIT